MRLFCAGCFLLLNIIGHGQRLVSGVVIDAVHKKPLSNAMVFLSGTSFSTKTNELGRFSMRMPPGKYNLVASCARFETHSEIINAALLADSMSLVLQPKTISYDTVQGYEKTSPNSLRGAFQIDFFGVTPNTDNCQIKNVKAIHFYIVNNGYEYVAVADEPLIIENKSLGYTIYYQLESFRSNHAGGVSYSGYTFFQPMDGGPSRKEKWQENRAAAYQGSVIHFMRSVYLNKISEEGFEVRRLRKVLNLQPAGTKDTSHVRLSPDEQTTLSRMLTNDSIVDYRDQVVNPDWYKDIIGVPLTGDSIAYALDKTTAALDFNDFLLVLYRNKEAPELYQMFSGSSAMMSQLLLVNGRPIAVEANGSFYHPGDLLMLDYWDWANRIPMMLPFDYVPPPF